MSNLTCLLFLVGTFLMFYSKYSGLLILLSFWVFPNESVLCIRWPKCWSFSISRSSEYSGLISFRIDWFDLPAVQGTPNSLLQHQSSPNCIQKHPFFNTQLFYGLTFTSIYDYWKKHSFAYRDLCQQSNVSAF